MTGWRVREGRGTGRLTLGLSIPLIPHSSQAAWAETQRSIKLHRSGRANERQDDSRSDSERGISLLDHPTRVKESPLSTRADQTRKTLTWNRNMRPTDSPHPPPTAQDPRSSGRLARLVCLVAALVKQVSGNRPQCKITVLFRRLKEILLNTLHKHFLLFLFSGFH